MSKLFPIYEVGSLPKLNARVKAMKGETPNNDELKELNYLSNFYDVSSEEVVDILQRQKVEKRKLDPHEKATLIDFNAILNIRIQEKSGLDYVYDGEARRSEMYRHVVKHIENFKDAPEMIRSRGPDSWLMGICEGVPKLKHDSIDELVREEFNFVRTYARKPVKVPMDDPYMIAVMSDNKYYFDLLKEKHKNDPSKLRYEAKRELNLALAKNVIRPQVEAVVKDGAKWIQLDIPAATLDVNHMPIVVEGVNAVVDGINDVKFSLHMCYPRRFTLTDKTGYELLFPHILKLNPNINHLSLELANNDDYRKDLTIFRTYSSERKFEIGTGVIDITLEKQEKNIDETPKIVRDRILEASEILGDPKLVYSAFDCGARQLKLDRCIKLYETLVEGTELARKG